MVQPNPTQITDPLQRPLPQALFEDDDFDPIEFDDGSRDGVEIDYTTQS
tara:strand:+ start:2099 stop:2245 length:147 start_codon:yes stop_codon:yes gene_type:complete